VSWRLISIFLAALALAASAAGLLLGRWMVKHSPAPNDVIQKPLAAMQALEDGQDAPRQPPQPLLDGRLATPETVSDLVAEWEIRPEGLQDTLSNPQIATATTPISLYQARQIARSNSVDSRMGSEPPALVGIADIGDLLEGGAGGGVRRGGRAGVRTDRRVDATLPLQGVTIPGLGAAARPSAQTKALSAETVSRETSVGPDSGGWQAELREALSSCQTTVNLFDRPSCVWAARIRYCGLHNAWGQTDDCPARNF